MSLSSRLPRVIRGYDRAATDALLSELAEEQAGLERECTTLRDRIAQLEADLARHRAQEQLVIKTLLAATSHAATIREKARREAELLLSKARAELERRTARGEGVERDRADAEREFLRMRRLAHEMETGLASFLTRTLGQLRPEETGAPDAPRTRGGRASLVSELEAALKHEDTEPPPAGSDRPSSGRRSGERRRPAGGARDASGPSSAA